MTINSDHMERAAEAIDRLMGYEAHEGEQARAITMDAWKDLGIDTESLAEQARAQLANFVSAMADSEAPVTLTREGLANLMTMWLNGFMIGAAAARIELADG